MTASTEVEVLGEFVVSLDLCRFLVFPLVSKANLWPLISASRGVNADDAGLNQFVSRFFIFTATL